MKEITSTLISEVSRSHTGGFGTKVSWDSIFDSEEELIQCLLNTPTDPNKTVFHKIPRGYEYLDSFKKYYTKNGILTEKQMVQLKRLATELAYVNYVLK